jgi:2-keto-4-pentenoate hydratase/2-oxohepta-3-ene-1,7-dioic acid hydratase in catechol pathway
MARTFAPRVVLLLVLGRYSAPPVFLTPGDVMEVDIEGLGILRNRLV